MGDFWKTEKFKKLDKEWKKKLEKDKFPEIEQEDEKLKTWSSHYFSARYSELTFANKAAYFDWCEAMLHQQDFKGPTELAVWFLHSRGYTDKEIGEVVNISGKGIWSMRQRIEKGFKNEHNSNKGA